MSNQVQSERDADDPATRNPNPIQGRDAARSSTAGATLTGEGRIVGIRGGVVDVLFEGTAPRIQELVYAGELAMEVASLLANGAARCMALAPVRGLGLGMTVHATGAPIEVPVGDAVLGRMLNVFGEPLDGKPAPVAVARRPRARRRGSPPRCP